MSPFTESNFLDIMRQAAPISNETAELLAEHLQPVTFSKHEMVLKAGVMCKYLWMIERGSLRHFWLMEDGREINTSFSVEGHLVFSMDEVYYGKSSEEYAETMEPVEAWRISVEDMNFLFETNLELCNWGRIIHQNEYRRLHRSHKERLTLTAAERYRMFKQQFPKVHQRANLGFIASYLGITQSTLSRLRAEE